MALKIEVIHYVNHLGASVSCYNGKGDTGRQYSIGTDGFMATYGTSTQARYTAPRGSKVWFQVVGLMLASDHAELREFAAPFVYTVPTAEESDLDCVLTLAVAETYPENVELYAATYSNGFLAYYAGKGLHSHGYADWGFRLASWQDGWRAARDEYESAERAADAACVEPVAPVGMRAQRAIVQTYTPSEIDAIGYVLRSGRMELDPIQRIVMIAMVRAELARRGDTARHTVARMVNTGFCFGEPARFNLLQALANPARA